MNLISTTTTSSAAFPGGEAFDFTFSPNGHWTLALSSSRIFVIDTVSSKVSVQRELKVLRRPVSAAILNDGSTLAVLSTDREVNVYSLTNLEVSHIRSVPLDNAPHAITLAPKGEVVAAAFDGGIEVHSLISPTSERDRRAIKCDRVDALRFSNDGSMLIGTTKSGKNPSTVILSAPYYTDEQMELPASDQISHLWTSQILFPNSSRDCSNATLLPLRTDGDVNWTFTYDKVFESFRAVRTDDLRNGTTYFTGPKHPSRDGPRNMRKKLTPSTLPASSACGELVAAGFLGKDIWLYGIPEGLDGANVSEEAGSQSASSAEASTPSSGLRTPRRSFTRGEAAELTGLPKWQVLVDKHRNIFAKGRQIAEVSGVSGLSWVNRTNGKQIKSSLSERLVIAAPGGIPSDPELEQDGLASIDGGRLIILDFDRTASDGLTNEMTFEVGNDEPELLEEVSRDMDTEVALARRRTTRRPMNPGTTVVDVLASTPPMPSMPSLAPTANAVANAASSTARTPATPATNRVDVQQQPATLESPDEGLSLEEASEAFGGPYSHTQPRSRTSIYRSATAVAAVRQRNPNAPRIVDQARVQYRRPGDRTELPHESDADNWVPPPPAYTAKADRPLPEELRRTLLPRPTEPVRRARFEYWHDRPRRSSTVFEGSSSETSGRRVTSLPERPSMPSRQRSAEASSPSQQPHHSTERSVPPRSDTVSPLSTIGSVLGDEINDSSVSGRRPSSASSNRRPISAFVGSIAGSLRRPNSSRFTQMPLESQTPLPQRPRTRNSISLPPSPTTTNQPNSPLTLTGGNLQQRLDYPLPPAPTNSSVESLNRRFSARNEVPPAPRRPEPSPYEEMSAMTAGLPSAQQLANLNHRSRQAPSPQPSHRLPSSISTPSGYQIPAPPRGALGAAGNPSSSIALHAPSRSNSQRNSFARSSPALLRPTPRRLDTIESVSSFVSRVRSRSKSRDLRTAGSDMRVRSHSVGPALVLDRVMTDRQPVKRGLFGAKKGKKSKIKDEQYTDTGPGTSNEGKDGKCMVM